MFERKRWKTKLQCNRQGKNMEGVHGEIMNKENEWGNMTQADAVEGPIGLVTQQKIVKAMGR